MTLSEDDVELMTRQFHTLFLRGNDPEQEEGTGGGDGPDKEGGGGAERHPPGPVPAAEGSLGLRHMADPVARVLAAAYFAKIFPMQALYARDAGERDALNRALVRITGVEPLLRDGRLVTCVVTWTGGRWPKRPTGLRVSLPGGEAERRRLLGRFEPHLRRMAAALGASTAKDYKHYKVYKHSVGHTQDGPPGR